MVSSLIPPKISHPSMVVRTSVPFRTSRAHGRQWARGIGRELTSLLPSLPLPPWVSPASPPSKLSPFRPCPRDYASCLSGLFVCCRLVARAASRRSCRTCTLGSPRAPSPSESDSPGRESPGGSSTRTSEGKCTLSITRHQRPKRPHTCVLARVQAGWRDGRRGRRRRGKEMDDPARPHLA